MTPAHDHYQRSQDDAAFCTFLEGAKPSERWVLVARFYAAMHLAQAYLLTKDARFAATRHDERRRALMASPELWNIRQFRTSWEFLQQTSEQARYDAGYVPRSTDFEQAKSSYLRVVNVVEPKLKSKLNLI